MTTATDNRCQHCGKPMTWDTWFTELCPERIGPMAQHEISQEHFYAILPNARKETP